jgi:hypothetical protein
MMKKIISLLLLLAGAVEISAQDNTHWQCDIHAYEFDMTVYYSLVYNDEAVSDMANYDVAAFVGDECRGVGEVQTLSLTGGNTVSYGYIRIRSNQKTGETVSLMVYDKTLDMECHVNETIAFISQSLIGLPSSPMAFTFYDERPVTVKVTNTSREYGEANPAFEYTVEGPDLVGVPEITSDAGSESNVGTYAIIATRGSIKNVNVSFVNGVMTVTKAPLTISGGEYTIRRGNPLPEFVATYSGFKNNETEEVLTTKPMLITEATSLSEPGTYDIIVSGAEAQNYEIEYVKGTLTILILKGDANNDGKVTITDAVAIVNKILGNPSVDFNVVAADINDDGDITITDAVGVVNIILNNGSSAAPLLISNIEEIEPE